MRFTLIDRVTELQAGKRLTATKCLSMAKEYLGDHFPNFPVMPGVLMLEAMTQAGAWLVRAGEDFAHSIVVLKQAANVKYAHFLEPGQTLTVSVELLSQTERESKLKAQGSVGGGVIVSGRLVLVRYNLAEATPGGAAAHPADAAVDEVIRQDLRKLWKVLYRPQSAAVAA